LSSLLNGVIHIVNKAINRQHPPYKANSSTKPAATTNTNQTKFERQVLLLRSDSWLDCN